MILSDRTIREQLEAGRITIEPFDESCIQPSSVDVRLDRAFRVFLNHTMPVIDVKKDLGELTRLVEVDDGDAFILHPGEFVLASTLERVALPDDLVARVEGKSSLGRLGLLIHSSLPGSEPLLVHDDKGLTLRTIGELVKEQRPCRVVSFDPETFEIGYHDVTGFYEGPADRIFEVRLASGRRVRVTAGHNLFTLSRDGDLRPIRTGELVAGAMVAVPRSIPAAPLASSRIDLLAFVPEAHQQVLIFEGPTIAQLFLQHRHRVGHLLIEAGYRSVDYYRGRSRLPWVVASQIRELLQDLGEHDRVGRRGERHSVPVELTIDGDVAWMLGMYVAKGHRRAQQVTISDTDRTRLDRLEATFAALGLPVSRSAGAVVCCSSLVGDLFGWFGMGDKAPTKRVPPMAFGWPDPILRSFLDGIVDGVGSIGEGHMSVWTTSEGLVADLLLLLARLGRRAACCRKETSRLPLWQVYAPDGEHQLLATVPLPDQLIRYQLDRLVDGGLALDRVVEVVDTGCIEPVYDLEVRPGGAKIENFLAGSGGVFVSNTAGFVDAGWDGHLTLELSNVANLPITLYPGMKIGQLSFMTMTTPADRPYGKGAQGSKYHGQRGPTPSRYFENFD